MEEEQYEETPKKKLRIDNYAKQMGENAENDEANLAEMTENEEKMPGTSLPFHGSRLPLELECEIYKFLSLPIQQKFLSGMGRGIYGYFGPRIRALIQAKRIIHPTGNRWNHFSSSRHVRFNPNRLQVMSDIMIFSESVYAEKGFLILSKPWRKDRFPGIIVNYFEVTQKSSYARFCIGLSNKLVGDTCVGKAPNSYGIVNDRKSHSFTYFSAGVEHHFVLGKPGGINVPHYKGVWDTFGCGIMFDHRDNMSIFFTANGTLLGKKIPLKASGIWLYPTVTLMDHMILEANFGDDLDNKPFRYDIEKCPGLLFE